MGYSLYHTHGTFRIGHKIPIEALDPEGRCQGTTWTARARPARSQIRHREREPEIRSIIAVDAEGFDDDKLMSLGQQALLDDR